MRFGHACGRWFLRQSRLTRIAIVAAVLGVSAGLMDMAHTHSLERRLMIADPDTIPLSRALARFAVKDGRAVYANNCASCHGGDGQGDPAQSTPSLIDADWLYGSGKISEIEHTVSYGIRAGGPKTWNLAEMPAYATPHPSPSENIAPLSPGDIRDVVEFLRGLEKRDADPAAAARGAQIYQGRGGCFDCHGQDAVGDPAIGAPNLTDSIWLQGDGSREAMFAVIAGGRKGVCPSWTTRLKAAEIRALAVYVFSLSHPITTAGKP